MAFIYGDRLVIKDANADEMLKATRQRDGSVHVEIEDPWAGNSETGFRVAVYVILTKEQSDRLGLWLATGEHNA
jgi:hypothetical protein